MTLSWSIPDVSRLKENDQWATYYVPHDDPHNVPHEETLEEVIEKAIREDSHITRAKIAGKAGVSVKTIARKLKEMDHIRYVGSGNNGHWEIDDKPE